MKDRDLEAAHLGKRRVDVEGVVVAAETVESSLLLSGLDLNDGVRRTSGGLVGGGGGATVGGLLLAAEAAAAAEEDGHLVVEELLAGLGVVGGDALLGDGGGALVDDLEELALGDETTGGGDGVLANLKVLLTVEEHHWGEVGDDVVEGEGHLGVEGRNNAEGGDDLEVLVAFKDVLDVGALGADAEVVEADVTLVELVLGALTFEAGELLDSSKVLVLGSARLTGEEDESLTVIQIFYTRGFIWLLYMMGQGKLHDILSWQLEEERESYLALAGTVLHVRHDLLDAVRSLLGVVRAGVEGDDIVPVLDDLLGGKRNVDREAVAESALPPGLAAPTGADLVETASGVLGNLVAAEGKDKGSNVVGLEGLDELLGKDGLGHGSTSVGSDGVDIDVVLGTLEGNGAGEAKDGAFLYIG